MGYGVLSCILHILSDAMGHPGIQYIQTCAEYIYIYLYYVLKEFVNVMILYAGSESPMQLFKISCLKTHAFNHI